MQTPYLDRFFAGEVLALSRLMSLVERGGDDAERVLNDLFPRVGRAYRVGVTGLTGAGKSELVNRLIGAYRRQGQTVGVVAADPTSPFSGGAILGDRVRMVDAVGDDGVFIRSIGSRGSDVGLSECAVELADVLDAFGRDVILLETIGIGQQEYRIRYASHTTLVVLTPESGDDVQSMKSGLMEVADVFVVNKSDRPDAARFADDLRSTVELRTADRSWSPPVVSTVATTGEGVEALADAVVAHRRHIESDGSLERHRVDSLRHRTAQIAEEKLKRMMWDSRYIGERLEAEVARVVAGERSPYEAAAAILAAVSLKPHGGES